MTTVKELDKVVHELDTRIVALEAIAAKLMPRLSTGIKDAVTDAVTFASAKEAMAAGKAAALLGKRVRIQGCTMYYV